MNPSHITITPEDGRRLVAAVRQLVAASLPADDRPDARLLPAGFRWVQGSGGKWAPLEDVEAC